jgi:glyoxylase-like metal-dependent hydrolase (beta-lactamase superfamily II)
MKYGKILVVFLLVLSLGGAAFVQAEEIPNDEPTTITYQMDNVEIIAINDSTFEITPDILIGDEKQIARLMGRSKNIGSVNTYLIKTNGSTILVDAGWGYASGNTIKYLAGLGIAPADIDSVIITHLHGDHIGALLNEGQVAFPNATLYVSAPERAYWLNDAEMAKVTDKTFFTGARAVIAAYGDKMQTFEVGAEVLPGILSIDENGHTPGHVGYLLETENNDVLFWGDITHFNRLQLAEPKVAVIFDVDPAQAIATREAILAWVAANNVSVAGAHIPYPGIGKLSLNQAGHYTFQPVD